MNPRLYSLLSLIQNWIDHSPEAHQLTLAITKGVSVSVVLLTNTTKQQTATIYITPLHAEAIKLYIPTMHPGEFSSLALADIMSKLSPFMFPE